MLNIINIFSASQSLQLGQQLHIIFTLQIILNGLSNVPK